MEIRHLAVVVTMALLLLGELPGAISPEAEECLDAHNKVRSKVDVPALVWSDELASYALQYAEKQSDHHQCAMVHSQGQYGENLFRGKGKRFTPTDAVHSWAKEGHDYDLESNSCTPGKVCGHYTQLVWADTKAVGCASVECPDGATFVICSYDPPGNFVGERPYQRSEVKPAQNATPGDEHGGDEEFNQAEAKLCQCMLSCVSKSRSSQWRHESTAK